MAKAQKTVIIDREFPYMHPKTGVKRTFPEGWRGPVSVAELKAILAASAGREIPAITTTDGEDAGRIISEATSKAEKIKAEAESEAANIIDEARAEAQRIIDEARADADRAAGSAEATQSAKNVTGKDGEP